MKGKFRNLLVGLCGAVATLGLAVGVFTAMPTMQASAESSAPTVTMLAGASARKMPGEPGIKFTAKIDNYDKSYQYGMLILPEAAWHSLGWDNDTDFIGYFNETGTTSYANMICAPYTTDNGDWQISFSLRNLYAENYSRGFFGVAYTLKDGVYNYADVDMVTNARSIAYVAQMALKYEDYLTQEQSSTLTSYANAGLVIEKDDYFSNGTMQNGGTTSAIESNYVARFDIDYVADGNSGETANSFVTKEAYAGGSAVSFKTYIPADSAVGGWWSVCWTTNPSAVNIYAHADGNGQSLSLAKGAWQDVSFTLPAGGPYYIYFAGAKGEWGQYGENGEGYVYIENFTVGSTTESFSANTNDWIFAVNTPTAVRAYEYQKASIVIGEAAKPLSAKIMINNISSTASTPSFITSEKYEGGTVTFDYYMSGNTNNKWWTLNWTTSNTSANIYAFVEPTDTNNGVSLPIVQDSWQTATVEVPAGNWYLYFAGSVGDWGEGYVLIDNLHIESADYTETFDFGLDDSIFEVNRAEAIVEGEGYEVVEDNTDYMLAFNEGSIGGNERIAMITDIAYSGVTEISFKAKWAPTATQTTDWGLSYTTDPTQFSYDHSNLAAVNCYSPKFGTLYKDVNVIYNYKLTISGSTWTMYAGDTQLATGSYTEGANYFYFVVNPKGGTDTAFYMDDFSITYADGTVVDTFEGGMSKLFVESQTKIGEGYGSTGMSFTESTFVESEGEAEKLGDLAMKMYFNNGNDGVRARTTSTYDGGSTVEFKYYIQADTATQWTRFIWDTDTSCDNYADTYISFGNTAGSWVSWSYTLPSGGPYYLYFGFECGNWADSSGAPYILIDDFTVNGEVETFDYGVANSCFTILQSDLAGNSEASEGFVSSAVEALGAKILINSISEKGQSFVSKFAYAGGGTVTFDYYMSGNTNNKWWSWCWSENSGANNETTTIYAHTGSYSGCGGVELPKVQDSWQTATVNIPEGTWYFYIGGAKGEWGTGYVILDNIVIKDASGNVVATENFNTGFDKFVNNRPSCISLAEGKEEFVPGEYAAKLDFSDSFNNDFKTFITKNSYAGGSTVSFMYMIPEETTCGDWWAVCYTDDLTNSENFWAVGQGIENVNYGGANPNPDKLKGQGWVEYSITLPSGGPYYLFFTGYQNWSGYVYIDNVTVNGEIIDNFNNGWEESAFSVGNSNYVGLSELGAGYVEEEKEEEKEEVPVFDDPYALEALLYYGTILSTLESGGYAWVETTGALNVTNIPTSMAFIEGSLSYAIGGEKEFAIWFGNEYYLYVNTTEIALYNDTQKVSSISGASAAKLYLSIMAYGFDENEEAVSSRLLIKLDNGEYIGLGEIGEPTEIKIVALGGDGSLSLSEIAMETYRCSVTDIPVYFSTESIDFTAYAFDSENMISEAGFQLLADAGFTKTLALLQGRLSSGDLHEQDIPDRAHVENLMAEVNADAMAAIELAEKYGLKHYVLNSNVYNIERNPNNYQWLDDFAELATYTLSSAFAGHFLADEPQSGKWFTDDELGELVNAYKAYKAAFPEGEAFINLLPRSSTQFTSESYYEDYIDTYIEMIALDYNGVPGTGYVSFDHYPLEDDGITSTHLRNLELIAEKCRDNKIELRTYIKASQTGDSDRSIRATESVNDLYAQIYSALAYGSKEIIYYQFTDHTMTDGSVGDSVISGITLNTTAPVYQYTKQVNNEVLAFSAAYMNFTWKSASFFGTSCTQSNNLNSNAGVYGCLSNVATNSGGVLVGNFDDADGAYTYGAQYGYMVVNYGDPQNGTAASGITLTFNGTPTRVLVYENGKARVVNLANNACTLNLEVGEGAFVIPLENE